MILRIAFVGPSLRPRDPALRGFEVRGPARQGDVWRALRDRPRAIALVDGVFEGQPSVWHHELLDALDAGVAVVGGGSMGALRAAELWTRGMQGAGRIFEWYRDGRLIDDGEVALLHAGPEHGWAPFTVPLVNVRHAAQRALEARVLGPAAVRALVRAGEELFYGERTWAAVRQRAGLSPAALARWDAFAARGLPDLKADDARAVLQAARRARPLLPGPRTPAPPAHARQRRLSDAHGAALRTARALADADSLRAEGARTLLLAAIARERGLRARPEELRAEELAWRLALGVRTRAGLCTATGLDVAELLRACEDLALARLAVDHAARFVNDGPSPDEALAFEARRRGRWAR